MYENHSHNDSAPIGLIGVCIFLVFSIVCGGLLGCPAYSRYQQRMNLEQDRAQARFNAENQVSINNTVIKQTAQLVQVEQQKADIRIVDAKGIAEAQRIINATLTDRYLQHEAIQAQEQMANSPNHTTIYIPSGQNGIPLVKTVDGSQ